MKPYSKRSREELEEMMNSDSLSERQKFRIKAFLSAEPRKIRRETVVEGAYVYSTGKWV